ncbi:hypothetical protein [Ancylobacter polymorphus]|uniref:Uncharacterized protein n=1 Tax=Ancylobacter polymorphus TaxID=223390 RepID=A0A9E7D6J5_9HYPH|nr:hypothetical protein [Ancylobacter polymorphus]UOK72260.1 hypothetical protein K9D25_05965 [Ancylobacter polymorphus]
MLKTAATALCLLLGLAAAQAQETQALDSSGASTGPSAAVPPPAPAGDALPAPVACTFEKVFVCTPAGCNPSPELGTIDLPAHFLIHFGEQIIASVSDDKVPHISSIQSVIGDGDTLILDGNDNMAAWAIQLSLDKPEATLTTLAGGKVLTSFGTCAPAK